MKKTLFSFLAVTLIIEEWLWDSLTAFGRSLVRWLKLQPFERWLSHTTPNQALVAFSIPILIATLINFVVIGLLTHGFILQGFLLELLAKLLGTILIARVFALTKPQLLTFDPLRVIYTSITGWLQWAHHKIIETSIYQWSKGLGAEVEVRFASWLR